MSMTFTTSTQPQHSTTLYLLSSGECVGVVIAFDILGQHLSARGPRQLLLSIPDRSASHVFNKVLMAVVSKIPESLLSLLYSAVLTIVPAS